MSGPPPCGTVGHMRRETRTLMAGAAVLCVTSGVVGGLLGAWWAPGGETGTEVRAQSVAQFTAGCDVTDVAARVFPSLVTVQVEGTEGSGLGSGSVLDRNGNILTND